jgi:tetratricopeptide (TPR) repeat protein
LPRNIIFKDLSQVFQYISVPNFLRILKGNLKHIFLLFVLFTADPVFSQEDPVADSLDHIIKTTKEDTTRVIALNNLFIHYEYDDTARARASLDKSYYLCMEIDYKRGLARVYSLRGYFEEDKKHYEEAIRYHFLALNMRKQTNDLAGEAKTYNSIGVVYTAMGKQPFALQYYIRSLELKIKLGNKKEIADSYYNIAFLYNQQGDYPKAQKNAYNSLKLLEELKDSLGIANCYTFIGLIYDGEANYNEALKYHQKSLKILLRLGEKKFIADTYSNMANTFSALKKYKESLLKHIRALRLYEEVNDKFGIAVAYNNLGLIYSVNGNNNEALKNHFASLKIKEELGSMNGIAVSCINIGDVFITTKKYEKAREYLLRAKALSEEGGWKEYLKFTYLSLTKLDSLQGNFKRAYTERKMYHLYRDSLDNEEVRKKATEERLNYEFEKKEAISEARHTKELQHNKALDDERKHKKNLLIAFICLMALLVIFVALFVYRGYLAKKKVNIQLYRKNNLIEHQKKEVEEKNKKINESIQYASRIQKAVLPPGEEFSAALPDSFIFFRSKELVSGDFYWYSELEDKLVVVVAESATKGVPGAFVSMIGNTMLNEIVNEKKVTDPGSILLNVNKGLNDLFRSEITGHNDKMDVSVTTFDKKQRLFSFAGANQEACMVTANKIIPLNGNACSLGSLSSKDSPFSVTTIKAEAGASLYLFTRGFTRQFHLNLKERKTQELFMDLNLRESEKGKEHLAEELDRLTKEKTLEDDVLLLKLQF